MTRTAADHFAEVLLPMTNEPSLLDLRRDSRAAIRIARHHVRRVYGLIHDPPSGA